MSNDIDSAVHWQIESLRFTLFYDAAQRHSIANLWQTITGLLPKNRTERPQEEFLIEEGPWNDHVLSISTRPERIDIMLGSSMSDVTPDLPNIGKLNTMTSITANLLDKLPFENAIRLAFGIILLHPENDHSSAYQSLAKLLPNIQINPASRDFLYQINLPTQSKNAPSIEINTIRRWSAIVLRFFTISISDSSENKDLKELFATRLELDINTSQNTLLTSSVDKTLMSELVAEAIAIAEGKDHA